MPSGDYAAVGGGGALKLKGAKVQKKKKRRDKSGLERTLSAGEGASAKGDGTSANERQPDEHGQDRHSDDDAAVARKTESERKYDEVRKKRLQKMAESSSSRPELLKTHKERVEELNTYLSKLSEHHDMPKIGPG
ncbi:uncharacterized protein MAM_00421 [Metarhizium album ARSEF 1941]|uniref:DUF1754-domain-containing protein n=1 Tax=Metarhizium album (strain ARSEF 1941) TaxID=1081103 RepID=A0A0B2X7E3_METAS|nr:uncharacterized protein MAM_00421 [Metarhizium album ARSEF 1941]KHO01420.1 hypothetical protein MAM_00421 [Metarhizium album ARSEF 1941]